MDTPVTKLELQKLVNKANEIDKRRSEESESQRVRRLLIESSIESIYDAAIFRAKMGNIFFKKEYLSNELIMDIYDGVKLLFPDCKILLNLKECSITIYWGDQQ